MSIDLKTIKHISKLSRISVDEERADKLAKDLSSIFEFIEKLNELKTDNVEPLTSVAETTLKLRSDEIKSDNIRDQIIKNSPDSNEDYFVVPKVIAAVILVGLSVNGDVHRVVLLASLIIAQRVGGDARDASVDAPVLGWVVGRE